MVRVPKRLRGAPQTSTPTGRKKAPAPEGTGARHFTEEDSVAALTGGRRL